MSRIGGGRKCRASSLRRGIRSLRTLGGGIDTAWYTPSSSTSISSKPARSTARYQTQFHRRWPGRRFVVRSSDRVADILVVRGQEERELVEDRCVRLLRNDVL